jgi:hypothetical protein
VNKEKNQRCQGKREELGKDFECEESAAEKRGGRKNRTYWPTAQTIHKQLNGAARA